MFKRKEQKKVKKIIEHGGEKITNDCFEKTELNNSLYFIDDLCDEKYDSIGFGVYVDSLIVAINSKAKMIGIISNFGSGKSTILNMMKKREEMKDNSTKICSINLWSLPSQEKNKQYRDLTIDIHKSLLNQLINTSNFNSYPKKSLKKQINKNYGFFDIVIEDEKLIFPMYLLFILFIFNVIMKLEIFNFNVPKISIFILDLCIAINFVYILTKSKLYFSFNKESKNTREIDEYETIECFSNIVNKYKKNGTKKLVICIEDIDRFANKSDAIRFLEQVYKFYNESTNIEGINVTFIVSIKPAPYFEEDNEGNNNLGNDSVKNIYEKIFDYILTLNPVAIQNYDVLIENLLLSKRKLIEDIGLSYPDSKEAYYWKHLYRGNHVTIRDIKHRYNYAVNLYCNLKKQVDNIDDVSIEIEKETCFYVAYLEDEFTDSFYELIKNSYEFEKMVNNYLIEKKILLCSNQSCTNLCLDNEQENLINCPYNSDKKFYKEIEYGLINGLIDSNFSMYFYKFPMGKKIKNIYDAGIRKALLQDNGDVIPNFFEYANNCNETEIIDTLGELVEIERIPNLIFENKRIFGLVYDHYTKILQKHISEYSISKEEKKTIKLVNNLKNINDDKANSILYILISNIATDLKNNVDESKIPNIRLKILDILINIPGIYFLLFTNDLPKISLDEIKKINDINKVLKILNANQIDEELLNNINIIPKTDLSENVYFKFIEKIISIDDELFRKVFYAFKPSHFKITKQIKYDVLKINNIVNKLNLFESNAMLEFFQFYQFIPSNLESSFIEKILNQPSDIKKTLVGKYQRIIIELDYISIQAIDFFENYNFKYGFTTSIESKFYKKGRYELYVYSKAIRTGKFSLDESDKIDKLKDSYLNYLYNSTILGIDVHPTIEILSYLYKFIVKSKMTISKIILFNELPQTLNDVEYVIGRFNTAEINEYFKKIRKFAADQNESVKKIYEWANSDEPKLSYDAYRSLLRVMDFNYRTKFGVLKRKKKLNY